MSITNPAELMLNNIARLKAYHIDTSIVEDNKNSNSLMARSKPMMQNQSNEELPIVKVANATRRLREARMEIQNRMQYLNVYLKVSQLSTFLFFVYYRHSLTGEI